MLEANLEIDGRRVAVCSMVKLTSFLENPLFFKMFYTITEKCLLGRQVPKFKETSSIAISPVKLFPVIPSNVTCNNDRSLARM